jgi:hypothetical protein
MTDDRPKRRLSFNPRFSSLNTELRLLRQMRTASFAGDHVAAECLIRLGREDCAEKERRKKLDLKMERARAARRAKAAKEDPAESKSAGFNHPRSEPAVPFLLTIRH